MSRSRPERGAVFATADTAAASSSAWHWSGELRGALNATTAMLPFVLSYGFIAFGVLGAAGVQPGLGVSVVSAVLGGWLLAWLGWWIARLPMPAASPSASSCLIVASGLAVWLRDPALQPAAPGAIAMLLALVGCVVLLAGALQVLIGLLGGGSLVRYVPQPVLAGFANGVAVLIALSQLAPALGLDAARLAREGWPALEGWQPAALAVALATAALVWLCGRIAPRWPAALLALLVASVALWALGRGSADAAGAAAAPVVATIGPLQLALPLPLALQPLLGDAGVALLQRHTPSVLATALLLALIGALESVLNLAAVDQRLGTRSDPDRALVSMGLTNIVLGLFGALPVVYLRLRALATADAGGRSWRALALGSALLALVFTLGLPLLEHCPKPVVAGIVVMLAWTLVDPWTVSLLRRGLGLSSHEAAGAASTAPSLIDRRLSLAVMATVCLVTVLWGFVPGVALGVLLSFVLLVRALKRSLVRLRYSAAEIPSRRVYTPVQEQRLAALRPGVVVCELEGALFFGNVERLEQEVQALAEPAPGAGALHTLVLDLRRVSTIDASGAVMLARLRARLLGQGVALHLAGVRHDNRHGESLRAHGVLDDGASGHAMAEDGAPAGNGLTWALHHDADRAIEAAELHGLVRSGLPRAGAPIELVRCELFAGLDAAAFARVSALLCERRLAAGERLFSLGDPGDALYVLSAGSISVTDPARHQRFVSFSAGMTFGEMALLDGGGRTADAVADEPSTVHGLGAAALSQLEVEAPAVASALYRNLALHLAVRLRAASEAWRRAAS
jgi:sulfate permease, SulP family